MPPKLLSLRNNHDEVVQYFQWLRHIIYNKPDTYKGKVFVVDFSNIEEISPGAGLVLAAELNRWQDFIRRKLWAHRQDKWRPIVQHFMSDMGLFDLLSVADPTGDHDNNEETTYIKYIRGVHADGGLCASLLDMLSNVASRSDVEHFIYDGLVEALKNVGHHAYVGEQWYGVPSGTWWMCAAFDRKEGTVTACVYDPGVGIPATLPRSGLWERIQSALSMVGRNDDADMIAAAMSVGRTRTAREERGKGLPIMMRLIDHSEGHLRVVSGRGEAIYRGNGQIETVRHKFSLGGTLIEWTIRQRAKELEDA